MPTAVANMKLAEILAKDTASMRREESKRHNPIKHKADEHVPDRFELFLLDAGEKKVEWQDETRVPNTAVFTFNKEDHTLGNLISQRLLQYPYVQFSGYKVPHPLFAKFELRVTTDGSKTPREAVIKCCEDVVSDLSTLNNSFTTEWVAKRIVTEGERELQAREARGADPSY